MPKIQVQVIEPRFTGGPKLWKVDVPMEMDEVITRYGERLGDALIRAGEAVRREEMTVARGEGE